MESARVVVLGASSGLGRSIAIGLGQRGHRVALLARRLQRLESAAAETGPGTLAIECDVTSESSVQQAIAQAAAGLGGIDAMIYAPGVSPLCAIEETDAATWRWMFDTNVIGASTATAAALPHLRATQGKAIYLSSVAGSQTAPWPGLGAYAVSKAALDKLIDAWRVEHREIGFTRFVVGDCSGGKGESQTEFNATWDPAKRAEFGPAWVAQRLITGALVEVEEMINVMNTVVSGGPSMSMPTVIVTARPAPTAK